MKITPYLEKSVIVPSRSSVHVDQALTNISIAYMQSQDHFRAATLAPQIPSQFRSDVYYTFSRGQVQREIMQERAPSTESAGFNLTQDTDNFFCRVYAAHVDLSDQVLANADSQINLETQASQLLGMGALINRERKWIDTFWTTGVWGTDLTGVTTTPGTGQFKSWASDDSDPISDIKTAQDTMHEQTGYRPNRLVLNRKTYTRLTEHPNIIARLGDSQDRVLTKQKLANFFEIDSIEVLDAVSAGTAGVFDADTLSFMAGNGALLCYVNPNPGLLMPSAMYTFNWTYTGGFGTTIETIRMEHLKSTRYEVEDSFDYKLVASDLGYFFANTLAT